VKGLRVRALVLAAGLGTRLRPLTLARPKPLLPVAGRPLLSYTLDQLAEIGCEATAVNLHHLGEQIRDTLGERHRDMPLLYSEEQPEVLGTLGALHPLRQRGFFQGADVLLVINGDSLCRWPLKKLLRKHKKSEAAATLVVADKVDPARLGGGIGVDAEGRVAFFRETRKPTDNIDAEGLRRTVFAGVHAFRPALLDTLDGFTRDAPTPADFITDLYEPLLEKGLPCDTLATSRDWHDLGTPGRYLEGVLDWVQGRRPKRLLTRRSWIADGATVAPDATVDACAVEAGATIGPGATVEGSLLLPGARVGAGCTVRQAILGFDTVLPSGTYLEGRMVNPRRAGFTAGPEDSLLGELVYTPLEKAQG